MNHSSVKSTETHNFPEIISLRTTVVTDGGI